MLSKEGARLQVFLDLQRRHRLRRGPDELIILDEHTIERSWGWVFFYTTRGWRDGDFNYAVGGDALYIVNRDGNMRFAGTGRPVEEYIRDYESELERQSGAWELVIHEPADCSLDIAMRIRSALGMSVAALGEVRHSLPGVVSSGAFADLEPVRQRLIAAGVQAVVRRAGAQEAEPDAPPASSRDLGSL
jgi:hypothetical protein